MKITWTILFIFPAFCVCRLLTNRRTYRASLPGTCSVHVRVRPLSETEKEKGKAWRVESNSLCQADPLSGAPLPDASPYLLDTVFDGSCSTADVYERTARGLIAQVVEGFNSTVFAYGQTSSGKTHTMRGTDTEPGIIPLAVREIFNIIASTKDREFLLRVSYMEVSLLYNPCY